MARMNQRDQAHAYRFLARRLSSALVRDDPDGPDAPMRRLAIASFGSIMVAALVVAGVGVLGVVRPGGATAWKKAHAVILEKETGTRYLYTQGQLHPLLNYASARLVLGQQAYSLVTVSQASLRGVPRGLPIGIPGAPDELPTTAGLVTGPWSVCSLPARDEAGSPSAFVRLSAGGGLTGTALGSNRAVLVTSLDNTLYLVWNSSRMRIPGGQAALEALGYASTQPLAVGDAWLTVLPQGPDLAPPQLPGLGGKGPPVARRATRVGQVLIAAGSGQAGGTPQYYLVEHGGLAPLSVTEADLELADPQARSLYPPGRPTAISVPAASIAAAPAFPSASPSALPSRPPQLISLPAGQGAVCGVYQAADNSVPQVRTYPVDAGSIPTVTKPAPVGVLGIPLADQVRIPAGDGAVVQAVPAPGAGGGTMYLITSSGVKYPVPTTDVLASLGLSGVRPTLVPEILLDLLNTGPTLDPHAAARTSAP
ncbi:MAG TPA: type VII secretion protein EccB [Streptosporangiaceae bacterium]|nr:type VII secretion protein EccB [Streptosporangiaceae bacterium]